MHEVLLGRLRALPFDLGLLTDPTFCARHATDASRIALAPPSLVIRPCDTQGVSAALSACHELGQRVVVQGGLTGLSGGARVLRGEVALSLERLRFLGPVDSVAAQIEVGAGVPPQLLQDAVAEAGLVFGVDLGARGSATIGGMISTNAGGIRVLRYGMMRAQVLGVEAVLADGTVLSDMRGLEKNNAGMNLAQLFTGSEGTLGVITRARLRLHPAPDMTAVALCAVTCLEHALALLARMRRDLGPALSAFECLWPEVYAGAVGLAGQRPLPEGAGLYLLIEMQGPSQALRPEAFETVLMAAFEDGLIADVVLAQSGREASALWHLRELCTEFSFSLGRLRPHDLSLPLAALPSFVERADARVRELDPEAQVLIYGHLGDGNLHYLVRTEQGEAVSAAVNALAAEMGGSITAEHGVGLDKRQH
ncbi:FAD-binding oxidoreductase [Alloyangia pacifica]|uniref:FAD-binding oxidoreductase n=1 Tax=Alloyangia pacifica TaxID=311180 RepID=UPI0031D628BD